MLRIVQLLVAGAMLTTVGCGSLWGHGACAVVPECRSYEVVVTECSNSTCRSTDDCAPYVLLCEIPPTADHCEVYGWYGDGTCDESCHQPDPDCAEPCADEPACADGSEPTSTCEHDGMCVEAEACDVVYYCPIPVQCAAVPTCGTGYVEDGTSCPADTDCYEETVCGATVACRPAPATCEAFPVCEEGHQEVPFCDVSDITCVQEEMCDHTIYCQAQCDELPTCADGYVEDTTCDASVFDCYEVSECGTTIACRAE